MKAGDWSNSSVYSSGDTDSDEGHKRTKELQSHSEFKEPKEKNATEGPRNELE